VTVILILLSLAALCLGIFGWLWLCAGFRRGGLRGALGIAAVQISGLCLAYGVLRGMPMLGLFTAMFPPLALPHVLVLGEFPALIALVLGKVVILAGTVLGLALMLRPLRVWAPGLALLAALIGGAVMGDAGVERAMCEVGAKRGFTAFSRMGFADSMTADPASPATAHGEAEAQGQRFGWSYRLMDWYVLPEGVRTSAPPLAVTCSG
jgi:hypothetical protein